MIVLIWWLIKSLGVIGASITVLNDDDDLPIVDDRVVSDNDSVATPKWAIWPDLWSVGVGEAVIEGVVL